MNHKTIRTLMTAPPKTASHHPFVIHTQKIKAKQVNYKDALQVFPTRIHKRQVNEEIKTFDPRQLKRVVVHFASGYVTKEPFNFKFHGNIAIANPTQSKEKNPHARIYFAGPDIMSSPFKVSTDIVLGACYLSTWAAKYPHLFKVLPEKLKPISSATKQALKALHGNNYVSVMHFLRALLLKKSEITHEPISNEELLCRATYPDEELQTIILFKELHLFNRGAIISQPPNFASRKMDRILFETGKTSNKIYADVDPDEVRTAYAELTLANNYLNEKGLIGKATDIDLKLKSDVPPSYTAQMIHRRPKFNLIPLPYDSYQANCNKSTATILAKAEERTAAKQHRKANTNIEAASRLGFGAKQRMYFWDPLEESLQQPITKLLDVPLSEESKVKLKLKSFAQKKHDIFHVICDLPRDQQIKALEQALDRRTALGYIFSQPYPNLFGHFVKLIAEHIYHRRTREQLHKIQDTVECKTEVSARGFSNSK